MRRLRREGAPGPEQVGPVARARPALGPSACDAREHVLRALRLQPSCPGYRAGARRLLCGGSRYARRARSREWVPRAPSRRDQQHRPHASRPRPPPRPRPRRIPGGRHPVTELARQELRPRADLRDARARSRPGHRPTRDISHSSTRRPSRPDRSGRLVSSNDAVAWRASRRIPRTRGRAVRPRDAPGGYARLTRTSAAISPRSSGRRALHTTLEVRAWSSSS